MGRRKRPWGAILRRRLGRPWRSSLAEHPGLITLAVADMFLVERLLLLLSQDGYFPRRLFGSSCRGKPQVNSRIATRVLLLAVLLVALQGDQAYLRLFYLSGFGFFFIWVAWSSLFIF